MTLTAIGCDLTPAEAVARARRALQHLLAAPAVGSALLLLLGAGGTTTWSQVGASGIGAALTYLVHNAPGRWRAWSQAIVPVLFAVVTAAIPVLTTGKLSGLPWAAALLPALHLLAAGWNAATPTARASTRASRAASQVVATLGQETGVADIAAPLTARQGGEHQSATRTETTALPVLTQAKLAEMDAARAAAAPAVEPAQVSETSSTTSTPAQAPGGTSAGITSAPAGFAPTPVQQVRRPGLRQPGASIEGEGSAR